MTVARIELDPDQIPDEAGNQWFHVTLANKPPMDVYGTEIAETPNGSLVIKMAVLINGEVVLFDAYQAAKGHWLEVERSEAVYNPEHMAFMQQQMAAQRGRMAGLAIPQ